VRVMLDGDPGAEPSGWLDAWLVSDDHAELMAPIRKLAQARGLEPRVGDFMRDRLRLEFHLVVHTAPPSRWSTWPDPMSQPSSMRSTAKELVEAKQLVVGTVASGVVHRTARPAVPPPEAKAPGRSGLGAQAGRSSPIRKTWAVRPYRTRRH